MIPMGLMFGKRPWNNELHDAERATWKSRHVCGQPRPLPLYHPDSRGSAVSPNRVAGVVDRESADGTISMYPKRTKSMQKREECNWCSVSVVATL